MTNEEDVIKWLEAHKNTVFRNNPTVIGYLDMAISALKPTRMIDKSNFNPEQYKADLQSAYDCGYNKAESEGLRVKQFIKVTELYRGMFDNIEHKMETVINLSRISKIYDDEIIIGEERFMKLTPESMESLKEYIKFEDCTGNAEIEVTHDL